MYHACAEVFNDTFSITNHTASNERATDEWQFGTDLKRKSGSIIMVLSQNLPGGTEVNHK
jgi:hypothetical protein